MKSPAIALSLGFWMLHAAHPATHTPPQDDGRPRFEVASVKPNRSGTPARGTVLLQPGGRLLVENASLGQLVRAAFFDHREIAGGPGWIETDRFDIAARGAENHRLDRDGMPRHSWQMLQSLLADRFQLKVHAEVRERPVFALVVARRDGTPGPQLKRSDHDCVALMHDLVDGRKPTVRPGQPLPCSVGRYPGSLNANALTLSQLADILSGEVGRPVVDRTGLDGPFDFRLTWAAALAPQAADAAGASAPDTGAPSIFTALQEQLGLKLESTRAPVDVLIVDNAERPTPD